MHQLHIKVLSEQWVFYWRNNEKIAASNNNQPLRVLIQAKFVKMAPDITQRLQNISNNVEDAKVSAYHRCIWIPSRSPIFAAMLWERGGAFLTVRSKQVTWYQRVENPKQGKVSCQYTFKPWLAWLFAARTARRVLCPITSSNITEVQRDTAQRGAGIHHLVVW